MPKKNFYNVLYLNILHFKLPNKAFFLSFIQKNSLLLQKFFFRAEKVFINLKLLEMSEIKEKVVSIIVDKLGVDPSEVVETANFTQDLGADSLDTVELILDFEKEFGVSIPDDQTENIQTVGDAIKYIEEHKA